MPGSYSPLKPRSADELWESSLQSHWNSHSTSFLQAANCIPIKHLWWYVSNDSSLLYLATNSFLWSIWRWILCRVISMGLFGFFYMHPKEEFKHQPNHSLLYSWIMPCSVTYKNASYCIRKDQIQKPTARHCIVAEKLHSVLNVMSPSNPSSQGSESHTKEEEVRECSRPIWRGWRTPRKLGPLNQQNHHTWTHRDWVLRRDCTSLHQMGP